MKVLSVRSFALVAASALMYTASCVDFLGQCHGDALRVVPTMLDSVTVHVGAAAIVTAGEAYGICESPPARDYDWNVSGGDIVSLFIVDAIHARLTGVRPGQVTVTPKYRSSGVSLSSVTVTVVP